MQGSVDVPVESTPLLSGRVPVQVLVSTKQDQGICKAGQSRESGNRDEWESINLHEKIQGLQIWTWLSLDLVVWALGFSCLSS